MERLSDSWLGDYAALVREQQEAVTEARKQRDGGPGVPITLGELVAMGMVQGGGSD